METVKVGANRVASGSGQRCGNETLSHQAVGIGRRGKGFRVGEVISRDIEMLSNQLDRTIELVSDLIDRQPVQQRVRVRVRTNGDQARFHRTSQCCPRSRLTVIREVDAFVDVTSGEVEGGRHSVAFEHRECFVDNVGCSVVEGHNTPTGEILTGCEASNRLVDRKHSTALGEFRNLGIESRSREIDPYWSSAPDPVVEQHDEAGGSGPYSVDRGRNDLDHARDERQLRPPLTLTIGSSRPVMSPEPPRLGSRLRRVNRPLIARPASLDEIPAIVELAGRALAWNPRDPNEAFFRWKHFENPAGPSPMWVATAGDESVGFRAMLRWVFVNGDTRISAVRAVDTATAPEHRRRGIFRLLTRTAVDEMINEGAGFVFNTPNDSSRPGYLSMGWVDAGRVPTSVTPSGVRALSRLPRARMAAEKWSEPFSAGDPIDHVADDFVWGPTGGTRTERSADYVRWRYGFEPLQYRVLQTDDAAAVVRIRRRGPTREAVVAELRSPSRRATRRLFRMIGRLGQVDHLLAVVDPLQPVSRFSRIPGLGPVLTTRNLARQAPTRADLHLSLGDIELF